jgi:hypothetical protein
MKMMLASVLCVALTMNAIAQANGTITGIATVDGKPFANITVRLRNVDSGQLAGNASTTAQGRFTFSGLAPGLFVAEIVAPSGIVLGTSMPVQLTAAAFVTVGTSAAAAEAAGVDTQSRKRGAALVPMGLSATLLTVTAVGATLGGLGLIVTDSDASPLR